ADVRQLHVQQHQGRLFLRYELERFLPGSGLDDLEPGIPQRARADIAVRRIVVDAEDGMDGIRHGVTTARGRTDSINRSKVCRSKSLLESTATALRRLSRFSHVSVSDVATTTGIALVAGVLASSSRTSSPRRSGRFRSRMMMSGCVAATARNPSLASAASRTSYGWR